MRIHGGFLPKIAGKPSDELEIVPAPDQLVVELNQGSLQYKPLVTAGEFVQTGTALAEAVVQGGKVFLPAPASGTIASPSSGNSIIAIKRGSPEKKPEALRPPMDPATATFENIRSVMAEDGLWQKIWCSKARGIPSLKETAKPKSIIVHCVTSEPFRARGKVLLKKSWSTIVNGMRFLPRLLDDYGTIDVVLTDRQDPIARMMYVELAGHAWAHFHNVKVSYPVENPDIITAALRKDRKSLKPDDVIWLINLQTVEALGAGLVDGIPMTRRVVAVGGPGCTKPRHLSVTIGTPVSVLADMAGQKDKTVILRGGILKGEPVEAAEASVNYDDDGFFFLPEADKREFLGFVNPGFDRTSSIPCFGTSLTGGMDRTITRSLRGERRPCIACGTCEKICPANLLPQIIHRYLYRDGIDEAAATGLMHCVECNACSYVCPSKIELAHQFKQAKEQILIEKAEAAAAAEQMKRREEAKQQEEGHREDWRK